jgi:hypothetical protein
MMTAMTLQTRAPQAPTLTDYDRRHAVTYLRLLDAEAAGADWREVAAIVLGVRSDADPDHAEAMHSSHLQRARWLRDAGYRDLLASGRAATATPPPI